MAATRSEPDLCDHPLCASICTRRARTIDCHRIGACLNGAILDYGLFAPDREAWSRSVITLVRNVS
ncbi:MAG: hypothetical protein EOS23_28560 [Mesorhizobium sp.]|nr:hypothetical protein EOA85_19880 [Mesorhizobium sp. M5C.F.Ca.IN.020.29.1.1]RWC39710.1 MAG: hypothetical protein EOS28_26110 [Mesorhizobium sp.]RWD44531.1 MAG: hypothetical protein EOS59_23275 [Mesorhizobium sp.]RWE07194.1 MAG: hypothetical protein EOS23_28560 [Mesorhizobium sp.]RWE55079.1 MAG: hypothetical protein EOS24_24455 [Mesorhizobium sp.]